MKLPMKAVTPALVVVVSCLLAGLMIVVGSEPQTERPSPPPPLVQTAPATTGPVQFFVHAQGSVEPRTESDLISEIAGRIVWVSPQLLSGAFFEAGAPLLRIDDRDYQANLDAAQAAVERSRSQLALAAATHDREHSMRRNGAASKAQLDTAVHAQKAAAAGLREAEVALRRAELDLERCEVRAPYEGLVRDKFADVGQFVARGSKLARVYAIDYAEIRLPISDEDLAYLDLPLGFRDELESSPGAASQASDANAPVAFSPAHPEVIFTARFAGRRHQWTGRVVRTEGALDPRTRMVTVVARVNDPYARGLDPNRPPLAAGLFVEARITGRVMQDLVEIPRTAMRGGDRVAVVGADERLELRNVDVVRAGEDRVWVRSGLRQGERVCVSPVRTLVAGMRVRGRDVPLLHAAEEVIP